MHISTHFHDFSQKCTIFSHDRLTMGSLGESIHKFGSLNIWFTTLGSKMKSRGIRSGKILASWPTDHDQDVHQETFCLSAGTVQYYFRHSVKVGDERLTHYLAGVKWYLPHRESTSLYGNPVRVCENRFYPGGPSSFSSFKGYSPDLPLLNSN